MKSVTGLEINNPNVCIKDEKRTFVCVCKECMELSLKKHNEYADKMREQQSLQE